MLLGPLSNIAAALVARSSLGQRITVVISRRGQPLQSWGRFPPVCCTSSTLAIDAGGGSRLFLRRCAVACIRSRLRPTRPRPSSLPGIAAASPLGCLSGSPPLRWLSCRPVSARAALSAVGPCPGALDFLGLLPAGRYQRVRLCRAGVSLRLDARVRIPSGSSIPRHPHCPFPLPSLLAASRL